MSRARGPDPFSHPDLARAFAHRSEQDVHDPDSPDEQRDPRDRSEDEFEHEHGLSNLVDTSPVALQGDLFVPRRPESTLQAKPSITAVASGSDFDPFHSNTDRRGSASVGVQEPEIVPVQMESTPGAFDRATSSS